MSVGYVIKEAEVVYVEEGNEIYGEEFRSGRIKARLSQDESNVESIPWSFPLLPKTIQSTPKVGECVLIITSEFTNNNSNRFYIGPIISEPQRMEYDPYVDGRGSAISLLKGGNRKHLLKSIDKYKEITDGAFPKPMDVALVGRKSEDIILKDGEIDIRSGIRTTPIGDPDENLVGNVILNTVNPAYIQLKFKNNLTTGENTAASSIINVVADKINLISHQDKNAFKLTEPNDLINEDELQEIMNKLHQLPYGDLLVEYLTIMKNAIMFHGHNLSPGSPPVLGASITALKDVNFEKILSPNVRIS